MPFVLHSQPTGVFETRSASVQMMAGEAHRRYWEIMRDVEGMIDDHSEFLFLFQRVEVVVCYCIATNVYSWGVGERVVCDCEEILGGDRPSTAPRQRF